MHSNIEYPSHYFPKHENNTILLQNIKAYPDWPYSPHLLIFSPFLQPLPSTLAADLPANLLKSK